MSFFLQIIIPLRLFIAFKRSGLNTEIYFIYWLIASETVTLPAYCPVVSYPNKKGITEGTTVLLSYI